MITRRRLLLLAILVLAAFLRLWRLSELPPGLYHDEAYNGLDALSLLQGKTFPQFYEGWELYAADAHAERPPQETQFPIFFEGNYGREPLHIYLMALSIALFGPTPFAVRLVPALAGVLGVWTTYLAAKALTGDGKKETRYLPLIAALAVAIFVPAIHFSRFGLRVMLFLPISTLTVAFFWQGIKVERTRFFLLAGIFLGLGIYSYAAARLFPLLFMLFVPFWFWRERGALRRFWRPVALMAGTALLTALPLLIFFYRYPYFFLFRIGYVANKGRGTVAGKPWLTWLLNVGRVMRGLFWHGETHLRHNLPGRPFLDPIQSALALLGAWSLLRQKLDHRAVFLWLWLLVTLLPSILSGDAPHFGRLSGAAPPLAILVGWGAIWLGRRLTVVSGQRVVASGVTTESHRSPFTIHRLLLTVYCLLFTASLFFTGRDYYVRYANHPQLAADFYLPDWRLGQYAAAQPAAADLYLTPTQEEMATIYFALADPERLRSYNGAAGLIPAGEAGKPAVYLVRPQAKRALAALAAYFPAGDVPADRERFSAFHVPPQAPRLLVEAETAVSFADAIILRGWSVAQEENQLHVTLAWQGERELDLAYTAYVHLLNEAGELVAQQDRPPAGYPTFDWRPGELIIDTYTIPLPPDLPPGPYTIRTGFYYLPTRHNLGETAVLTPSWRP